MEHLKPVSFIDLDNLTTGDHIRLGSAKLDSRTSYAPSMQHADGGARFLCAGRRQRRGSIVLGEAYVDIQVTDKTHKRVYRLSLSGSLLRELSRRADSTFMGEL